MSKYWFLLLISSLLFSDNCVQFNIKTKKQTFIVLDDNSIWEVPASCTWKTNTRVRLVESGLLEQEYGEFSDAKQVSLQIFVPYLLMHANDQYAKGFTHGRSDGYEKGYSVGAATQR